MPQKRDQGRTLSEALAEFGRTPAFGVQRRLPEAQRRDPDCGSPFLWVLSFGEAKVKCLAAGRLPASRPTQSQKNYKFNSKLCPQLLDENPFSGYFYVSCLKPTHTSET